MTSVGRVDGLDDYDKSPVLSPSQVPNHFPEKAASSGATRRSGGTMRMRSGRGTPDAGNTLSARSRMDSEIVRPSSRRS